MRGTLALGATVRLLTLGGLPFRRTNVTTLWGTVRLDEKGNLLVTHGELWRLYLTRIRQRRPPLRNWRALVRAHKYDRVAALRAWLSWRRDSDEPFFQPRGDGFVALQTAHDRLRRICRGEGATVLAEVAAAIDAFPKGGCWDLETELAWLFRDSAPLWPRFRQCSVCWAFFLDREIGLTRACSPACRARLRRDLEREAEQERFRARVDWHRSRGLSDSEALERAQVDLGPIHRRRDAFVTASGRDRSTFS